MIIAYLIYDSLTRAPKDKRTYENRIVARSYADKLNLNYGSVRYSVRRV